MTTSDDSLQTALPIPLEELDEPSPQYLAWRTDDPIELTDFEKVHRLYLRLRRKNPVRRAAAALIRGEEPPRELIGSLLYSVQSPSGFRWRERIVAAWVLGRMRLDEQSLPQAARCLILMMRRGHERDTRGEFARWLLRDAMVACPLSMFAYLEMAGRRGFDIPFIVLFLMFSILLGWIVWPFSSWIDDRRRNLVRSAAAISIGRLEVPESIGDIALAMRDQNFEVRRRARHAFPKVAATLTDQDYGRLGNWTVQAISRLLTGEDDPVQRAALNALRKIGDGSAVEPVERVAEKGKTTEVRELAQSALPILRERRRRENDTKTLLRPADSPDDRDSILLRPASNSATPEGVLLRAVEGDFM